MPTCGVPVGDGQNRTRTSLMGTYPTRAAPTQDRAPGRALASRLSHARMPRGAWRHHPGRAQVKALRVTSGPPEEVPGLLRCIRVARVPGVPATCDLLHHRRYGAAPVAVGRDIALRESTRSPRDVTLVPVSNLAVYLIDGEIAGAVTGTAVVAHRGVVGSVDDHGWHHASRAVAHRWGVVGAGHAHDSLDQVGGRAAEPQGHATTVGQAGGVHAIAVRLAFAGQGADDLAEESHVGAAGGVGGVRGATPCRVGLPLPGAANRLRVNDDRGVTRRGVFQPSVAARGLRVVLPAAEHEHDRQVLPQAGFRHLDESLAGLAVDGEAPFAQMGVSARRGARAASATILQAADDAVDDA